MKKVFVVLSIMLFTVPGFATAETGEVVVDKVEFLKSEVIKVIKQNSDTLPGTDVMETNQTLLIEILDGNEKGKRIEIENDYIHLKEGDIFYVRHVTNDVEGTDAYIADEPYRLPQVFVLVGIFVVAILLFGGIQGVRGFVSLVGSLGLIIYVLVPGILHGFSPLIMTIAISSLIIIIGSYVTHGYNKTTSSAVAGMVLTVLITGAFAYWAVRFTHLSGFSSEEVTYLNLNFRGNIDILGLLLGGIMIGLLGVLYDVAIGQAISVEELVRIAPHVSRRKIYERAVRIGREHIGALVNTLAIAYVGTSLPLILLFVQTSTTGFWSVANKEIFATEIVRTLIGSIGLVLAVPITTFIAILVLKDTPYDDSKEEEILLDHVGHHH